MTRNRLLDAALDVFSEKSFADVTLSEIAERVGMTKGALYWHFKNKNNIFLKMVEEICLDAEMQFSEKYGEPKTLPDLRDYYKRRLVPPDNNDRFMKIHSLMLRRFEWPEEVRSNIFNILIDQIKREKMMVNDILLKAQQDNVIRQNIITEDVAGAITSVFYGLFILARHKLVSEDLARYADISAMLFRRDLTATERLRIFILKKEQVRIHDITW